MQHETSQQEGNVPDSEKLYEGLESEVSSAAARDDDVAESVRKLTFDALSLRALDRESLRRIINAVVEGARRGVEQEAQMTASQVQAARTRLGEAISGLDAALAQFAEASKLTMEEAVGRAQTFSQEDLSKVRADLTSLESMFLETLRNSARATRGFVADTLSQIVTHAERHGTAVGAELTVTLATLAQQMARASLGQLETGLQLAHATADFMREMAAGVFSGLADRLRTGHPRKDKEG
jgi:dGTP triphosphohydrolase